MRLALQITRSAMAGSSVSARKVFRQPASPQARQQGGTEGGIEAEGGVGPAGAYLRVPGLRGYEPSTGDFGTFLAIG
jgi:hypothetical protein